MTGNEWFKPAVNWDDGEPWWGRVELMLTFLCVHDLLSDGEKQRVRKRLQKQIDKGRGA